MVVISCHCVQISEGHVLEELVDMIVSGEGNNWRVEGGRKITQIKSRVNGILIAIPRFGLTSYSRLCTLKYGRTRMYPGYPGTRVITALNLYHEVEINLDSPHSVLPDTGVETQVYNAFRSRTAPRREG